MPSNYSISFKSNSTNSANILSNWKMKVAVEKFQELCGKEVLHDFYLVTIFWRSNVLYTLFHFWNQVRDNIEILKGILFFQVFFIFRSRYIQYSSRISNNYKNYCTSTWKVRYEYLNSFNILKCCQPTTRLSIIYHNEFSYVIINRVIMK